MNRIKLAIDPGHGPGNKHLRQVDPGACAGGVTEAYVALQWALTLKQRCVDALLPCYLTRTGEREAPLSSRPTRANAVGCTHYLSIHCNAGGGTGVEVFYRDQADRAFAEIVYKAALAATGLPGRGVKYEGASQHSKLAVFAFNGRCCLVEVGFIDCERDRGKLLDRDARIDFAGRIVAALQA